MLQGSQCTPCHPRPEQAVISSGTPFVLTRASPAKSRQLARLNVVASEATEMYRDETRVNGG